ncbi:MAG: hypothetical protein V4582_21900 [Pseudomonadota bacterium]
MMLKNIVDSMAIQSMFAQVAARFTYSTLPLGALGALILYVEHSRLGRVVGIGALVWFGIEVCIWAGAAIFFRRAH